MAEKVASEGASAIVRPRVTIGMPVFNVSQTLATCVASLLKQTFDDWELLLCDDCSSDDTREIAAGYGDPRIRFWTSNGRAGLPMRLNDCIDRARGEMFARMDGDDLAYPERFERQLNFLDARPEVDLVSSAALVFGRNLEAFGKAWCDGGDHEAMTRHPLRGFPMIHGSWMGKTTWFRHYRYDPRAIYAQDQELLYRAHLTSRYASIPEILIAVREERLDLVKMFRRRRSWMRYMSWHHPGLSGLPLRAYVTSILAFKIGLDATAILSGLDYKLLKHRARELTLAETERWLKVCDETIALSGSLGSSTVRNESKLPTRVL